MQNVYLDVRKLDSACRESYALSEDCMMENAAQALKRAALPYLERKGVFISRPALLVLCGGGNNGADGYALARAVVSHDIAVTVCEVIPAKSPLCLVQKERAQKTGVRIINAQELDFYFEETGSDVRVIADCIFGSGFHGALPPEAEAVIAQVNEEKKFSQDMLHLIACDIPSGLDSYGNTGDSSCVFLADETVTMGALKLSLYSDTAKDACGSVTCADLGVARNVYETAGNGFIRPDAFLLDAEDMRLPFRTKQNVHKGTFGHVAVVNGEKTGASVIASTAALTFGAGLVTLVRKDGNLENKTGIPFEIMTAKDFPESTAAVALGMGLGRNEDNNSDYYCNYLLSNPQLPTVIDADFFYSQYICKLLKERPENLVLTPHPKEFQSLLAICTADGMLSLKDIPSVSDCIKNRISYAKQFAETFPGVTLLLKGANTLIASTENGQTRIYINNCGTNALSKAGSGDVLAGLVAALLAQKYSPVEAAISASLCHALASRNCKNNFSLSPFDLISFCAQIKK